MVMVNNMVLTTHSKDISKKDSEKKVFSKMINSNIMVSSKITHFMVKVSLFSKQELNMKDSFNKAECMEKVSLFFLIIKYLEELWKMGDVRKGILNGS